MKSSKLMIVGIALMLISVLFSRFTNSHNGNIAGWIGVGFGVCSFVYGSIMKFREINS